MAYPDISGYFGVSLEDLEYLKDVQGPPLIKLRAEFDQAGGILSRPKGLNTFIDVIPVQPIYTPPDCSDLPTHLRSHGYRRKMFMQVRNKSDIYKLPIGFVRPS